LQGVFRAKAKEDCKLYFNNLAYEVEEGLSRNYLQPAYATVHRMKGSTAMDAIPVQKNDRRPCNSHKELLSRWTVMDGAVGYTTSACPELDAQCKTKKVFYLFLYSLQFVTFGFCYT